MCRARPLPRCSPFGLDSSRAAPEQRITVGGSSSSRLVRVWHASYDAAVLQKHADAPYSREESGRAVHHPTLGAIVGVGVFMAMRRWELQTGATVPAGAAAFIFGVVGIRIGKDRAFKRRLAALMMLCQMQIEPNTRTR